MSMVGFLFNVQHKNGLKRAKMSINRWLVMLYEYDCWLNENNAGDSIRFMGMFYLTSIAFYDRIVCRLYCNQMGLI